MMVSRLSSAVAAAGESMATLRQAPMLSIPQKTTDDVDLASPLRQFIRSHYGSVEKYAEECNLLNRLRQDIRGAGKDDMGRNLLYRYYGQLELLELRFPIDEEHIRIAFNWCDAFTEIPRSQHSLAYEKACVLFNLASILSYTASTQIRTEVEGMKKAYHSFQACAGLLNFINENFLHAPSSDLSREMVKTMSAVMLAQAQEVFTEKQIRDGGKASIIAKLAAETSHLYHSANEGLTELIIADTIDSVWSPFCQIKEKYFTGLAQYWQAMFEEEKSNYGSAVARLTLSQSLLKEAQSAAKNHSSQFARYPYLSNDPGSALYELVKTNYTLVSDKVVSVRKDNDVIYHETVLKESALPLVTRLASAKPISLNDLFKGQDVSRIIGHDIFHKLVPLAVHESASMYSEEIAKMLRFEQERSDIADTEYSTAFEYLGLPSSLNQFKLSDSRMAQDLAEPPSHIKTIAGEIYSFERTGSLTACLTKVQHLKQKIEETLSDASRALEEESRQCESMRAKFFDVWNQPPSRTLTMGFQDDIKNYRNSLASASQSDDKMQEEIRAVRSDLDSLTMSGPDSLDFVFQKIVMDASASTKTASTSLLDLPAEEEDTSNQMAIKVDQVDDAMRKLRLVKKERLQTLQDLKEKARKDDISEVLILNKKTPDIEQRVFASELEKFSPHRTRISATISRQEQLVEELTTVFTSVLEDRQNQVKQKRWTKIARQREETIQRLERLSVVYRDVRAGSMRATKFYEDLHNLSQGLTENIKRFVQQRQQEGRSLLQSKPRSQPSRNANTLDDRLQRLNINSQNSTGAYGNPPGSNGYQNPY